jgi:yeast amino acid transporter
MNEVEQIAGMVGTGLFLGLGQTLAVTGPLGVLLAYIHVATVVYAYAGTHFENM